MCKDLKLRSYLKYLLDNSLSLKRSNLVLDTMMDGNIIHDERDRRRIYFFFNNLRHAERIVFADRKELFIYQIRPNGIVSGVPFRIFAKFIDKLLSMEFDNYPLFFKENKEMIYDLFKNYYGAETVSEEEINKLMYKDREVG